MKEDAEDEGNLPLELEHMLGFTGARAGTMLAHLPHYSDARAALTGALAVFGPGTGDHVAMVHTPDPQVGNPLLGSHGRPGFDLVRLHDLAAALRPPVTMLSIAAL